MVEDELEPRLVEDPVEVGLDELRKDPRAAARVHQGQVRLQVPEVEGEEAVSDPVAALA